MALRTATFPPFQSHVFDCFCFASKSSIHLLKKQHFLHSRCPFSSSKPGLFSKKKLCWSNSPCSICFPVAVRRRRCEAQAWRCDMKIWLWVKKKVPKNPIGWRKNKPKPVDPRGFSFWAMAILRNFMNQSLSRCALPNSSLPSSLKLNQQNLGAFVRFQTKGAFLRGEV